jgi:murein DD-endopeptidase MepM/ murein hydrolase activator NlpD
MCERSGNNHLLLTQEFIAHMLGVQRTSIGLIANSIRPQSFSVTIPPRKSQDLVHLWRSNPRQGMKYTYTHSIIIGDPRARHLPDRPYLLPIPPGINFHFSQAFHGASTHTHPQSEYAVDIPMPVGTHIHAARGGVIMDIANDYFTGGKGTQFEQKANFIRVLHDDGTMAIYAHLNVESIQYPVGTRIERGQFIAESGNTGYSSGPHLHFAVQQNVGRELRSIPFEFENKGGVAFTPAQAMRFYR